MPDDLLLGEIVRGLMPHERMQIFFPVRIGDDEFVFLGPVSAISSAFPRKGLGAQAKARLRLALALLERRLSVRRAAALDDHQSVRHGRFKPLARKWTPGGAHIYSPENA